MMKFDLREIMEVVDMLWREDLDIRSVTLSLNTLFALSDSQERTLEKIRGIRGIASRFVETTREVEERLGVRVVTKRLAVSPVEYFLEPIPTMDFALKLGGELDGVAKASGADYVSGFSAFVERGEGRGARVALENLARVMNSTSRLSGSINAASTVSGLNAEAVRTFTHQLFLMEPHAASRVSIMCNIPPDSPFVPSAHHGRGMPNSMVSVAVSGPGVIASAVRRARPGSFQQLHEVIKVSAFKVTRLGELVGRWVSEELGVPMGVVDISVAPSPKVGDSVAEILEAMGLEKAGANGTVAALALMMDAVKKGGAMASNLVGGLSSTFIPVSEDSIMSLRVKEGTLSLSDLLAMSAVCNSGIDMVGVSRSQGEERVMGLILDVLSMGLVLGKILGVRVIPLDMEPGEEVDMGELLGKLVVAKLKDPDPSRFVSFWGFMPTPLRRLDMG